MKIEEEKLVIRKGDGGSTAGGGVHPWLLCLFLLEFAGNRLSFPGQVLV